MTDPNIYGRKASEIADSLIRRMHDQFGTLHADVSRQVQDHILGLIHEEERSELSYAVLERYAIDCVWDALVASPAWEEATEGRDECAEYIRERLTDHKQGSAAFRIAELAHEYFAQ